jgi:hypothetical protein
VCAQLQILEAAKVDEHIRWHRKTAGQPAAAGSVVASVRKPEAPFSKKLYVDSIDAE